ERSAEARILRPLGPEPRAHTPARRLELGRRMEAPVGPKVKLDPSRDSRERERLARLHGEARLDPTSHDAKPIGDRGAGDHVRLADRFEAVEEVVHCGRSPRKSWTSETNASRASTWTLCPTPSRTAISAAGKCARIVAWSSGATKTEAPPATTSVGPMKRSSGSSGLRRR